MTITLEGLTKQQYQIADMIWSCESQEDVDRLIRNLPQAYRQVAVVIHQLMIAAVMDQYMEITEDVKAVIASISRSYPTVIHGLRCTAHTLGSSAGPSSVRTDTKLGSRSGSGLWWSPSG